MKPWRTPPENLELLAQQVDVWCVNLDLANWQIVELEKTLSNDEITRANKYYSPQHKNRFIAARGFLRKILGRYLNIEPSQLEFDYSDRGKPFVKQNISFNLSHSQDMALYAVTRDRMVGVDIEYLRPMPDAEQIAKRFFSAREYEEIKALPEPQKQLGFFNCWTRKEAYVKAIGEGLAHSLDQIEVTLKPGEGAQIIRIGSNLDQVNRWSMYELKPSTDYIAALVVEGKNLEIECWQGTVHSKQF